MKEEKFKQPKQSRYLTVNSGEQLRMSVADLEQQKTLLAEQQKQANH